MSFVVRHFFGGSPFHFFLLPIAGIPENVGGKKHYFLMPEEFSKTLFHFVNDLGVGIVGGCCGTTPEHIKALINKVGNLSPKKRKANYINSISSLYNAVPLMINPPPIIVGEKTNANGSRLFRDLLAKESTAVCICF